LRDGSVIALERLDLVLLSRACVEALVSGRRPQAETELRAAIPSCWPDEHDVRFLCSRLERVERDPTVGEWLVRGVVLREAGALVGHAGFHGPPGVNGLRDPEAVEIGYTVFPPFRGRGYAGETARGLVSWARERGVHRILASVAPTNEPSLAIVRGLGFVHVGEQWDEEDGLELVFHLDDGSSPAPSSASAMTTSEPASPVEQ
jgi:RimJ/RimL family protein N-acetyltransferase